MPLLAAAALLTVFSQTASKAGAARQRTIRPAPVTAAAAPQVWPVEQSAVFDLYSNGLRIENEFAVSNEPRIRFPVYHNHPVGPDRDGPVGWRTEPAGVVFHLTESDQAVFAPSELQSLKRIGRDLLHYVRSHRSYHFLIDRFGRVYRVVRENDKANHAGNSVWSDRHGSFVNLNTSFLAIALEGRSESPNPMNAAQVRSARLLTEMLRSTYGLDPSNFVAHAQVSVNPSNMLMGYHTDWAAGLPYAELGLPDNYAQSPASVALFGFGYDDAFLNAMRGQPWSGLVAADDALRHAAAAARLPLSQYRRELQERYKRMIHAHSRVSKENQHETEQE